MYHLSIIYFVILIHLYTYYVFKKCIAFIVTTLIYRSIYSNVTIEIINKQIILLSDKSI